MWPIRKNGHSLAPTLWPGGKGSWSGSDLAMQWVGPGPSQTCSGGLGILATGRDSSTVTAPPLPNFPIQEESHRWDSNAPQAAFGLQAGG